MQLKKIYVLNIQDILNFETFYERITINAYGSYKKFIFNVVKIVRR